MYVPKHFEERERGRLEQFMRANDFALLVSTVDGSPFATHVPVLLDTSRGERGFILGHMARGNPQWRTFASQPEVLVVFNGPHCYVSPTWYVTSPNVPTWNYAAVHVYGRATVVEDPIETRDILDRLVVAYEGSGPGAWSMAGLPEDYVRRMVRGVSAFSIEIDRIEGKYKLSQNRVVDDRRAVLQRLVDSADPREAAVGMLMRESEPVK